MGTIRYVEESANVTVKVDTIPEEVDIKTPKKESWSFKQLLKFLRTWWNK